jgi:hypothetical protein
MQDNPADLPPTLFDASPLLSSCATKVCADCGQVLPLEDFYLKGRKPGERLSYCKACNNKRAVAWRDSNRDRDNELQRERYWKDPDKALLIDMRRRVRDYGLDPEEIMAHFAAHNGLCDICGQRPEARDPTARASKRLCIDHDHETKKFRGLICRPCNLAIGNMRDNPAWLIEAANYLERHKLS